MGRCILVSCDLTLQGHSTTPPISSIAGRSSISLMNLSLNKFCIDSFKSGSVIGTTSRNLALGIYMRVEVINNLVLVYICCCLLK